ncbi:HECT domain-containing protein [Phytophthora infestans]|uniref:E3 ubiquitin-protein ligase HACE1 n=1 Tax=Phytophthora infestans TaxID=4787 RepID=A0A833WC94_PHYIN|nr:HECT domain-containing protein [Phytophthora infestans]
MASTAPRRRRPNRKSKVKTDSSIALPPSPPITFQLVTAIRRNDLDAFSSLLQTPQLDVNRRTPQGDTPLVEICRYARLEMATRLLSVHGANVNVASSNRSANRVGLTPLIAAFPKEGELTQIFRKSECGYSFIALCVANGRTDEQNDTALLLLEQLLTYAKQQNQLEEILTAKPDKVNSLLHVAAGLGNWKALRMLRQRAEDFDVEFNARNAVEHSALHVVEMNAFQARSMQFCEPPRPDVEAGGKKNRGRNRRRQKQKKQEDKEEEEKDEVKEEQEQEQEQELEPSEADKQTFTRSRPDRAVEALEVTRTVMELAKNTGIGAIFSRKGDEGLRGLYIKSLVLAEVGLVSIVNEIAQMPDTQKEKAVYLDGFMYTVASVYPLSVKNAKEYQSLWRQALDKKSTQNTEATDDERVSVTDAATMELSRAGFNLILDGMFSYNSISKRVKVWTLILMHLLTPFATGSPLAADKRPVMDECSQLKFFERIIEKICRSGTKLAFCIFDRTDIEDDDSYDDEIEFHWLISLFELFLQFFAPYARTIRDEESKEPLGIIKSFQRAIKPVKQLWPLVNAALGIMDDTISTPQRFSLLLHLLQVLEQLEAAFTSNEDMALVKLFGVMNRFVKQEAKKKRFKMFVSEQSHLLHTIAATFPIPTSFTDKVIPLKNSVDVLIRSDPKVLGMDLYSFAAIPGLIRLEHKVDYLSMLAEERNGSVSVSISRASDANYVDFILQQILSTSTNNLKAEMNITLVNEPGVGAGVTREFFQIVQRCFFQPGSTGSSQSRTVLPAPHVQEIGRNGFSLLGLRTLKTGTRARNATLNRANRLKAKRGVVGIAPRPVYISKQVMDAKRKAKSLSLSRKDMLVDPSEVDALKRVYLCIGRLMGLAIRNHQPLAVDFPLAFWKLMMRDGSVTWENYCESSAVFKRSLQFVLDHDFDAQSLDMRFEYTTQVVIVDEDASTKQKDESDVVAASTTSMEMELQDGMGNVEVTNANKAQYVLLRAQQFFFGHELMYYKKIRDGFNDTIVRSDLKLFRPEELQRLVRGEQTIDLQSLKRIVVYSRGALPSRGVVQRFWEVAEGFDQEYRSKLLTFWSGSPLPPIFGFDSTYRSMNADIACWYIDVDTRMQPSFCPMANTCDRRLILPDYPSSAMLREKLLVALDHGSVGYDRM